MLYLRTQDANKDFQTQTTFCHSGNLPFTPSLLIPPKQSTRYSFTLGVLWLWVCCFFSSQPTALAMGAQGNTAFRAGRQGASFCRSARYGFTRNTEFLSRVKSSTSSLWEDLLEQLPIPTSPPRKRRIDLGVSRFALNRSSLFDHPISHPHSSWNHLKDIRWNLHPSERKSSFELTQFKTWVNETLEARYLDQGESSDHPTLIFLAGPPCAGKNTVAHFLNQQNELSLESYLYIHSDGIDSEVQDLASTPLCNANETPDALFSEQPVFSSTELHLIAQSAQENLLNRALALRKHILFARPMNNLQWHQTLIHHVKTKYPEYRIEIIEVTATAQTIFSRIEPKEKALGHRIDRNDLRLAMTKSPETVWALKDEVSRLRIFENETAPFLLEDLSLK